MQYYFSNILLILYVKYFYNQLRFKVVIDRSFSGATFFWTQCILYFQLLCYWVLTSHVCHWYYLIWQINLFFKTVLSNSHNNKISMYYLRSRAHNITLTSKSCFYDNCNFITRMLFKGTYWSILTFHSLFYLLSQCGLSLFLINEHYDDDDDSMYGMYT